MEFILSIMCAFSLAFYGALVLIEIVKGDSDSENK